MSTPSPCPACGAALDAADRFCPSCGRPVDPAATGTPETPFSRDQKRCPYCGQSNDSGAPSCSSCGAMLGSSPASERPVPRAKEPGKSQGPFKGWKFTLGIAAVLVAALILLVNLRQDPPEPAKQSDDPHDAAMMGRIRDLQDRTDRNPNDAAALLEFANLLYDVRFYDRAAGMYARYLAIHPENADARVDMGTSYFQMAFSADSNGGGDLTAKAESCFLEAIRIKPNHQLAHFNLGIIELHRGDVAGANEWFRKCVAIDPGTEAARRAQQLMSQHIQNKPS